MESLTKHFIFTLKLYMSKYRKPKPKTNLKLLKLISRLLILNKFSDNHKNSVRIDLKIEIHTLKYSFYL